MISNMLSKLAGVTMMWIMKIKGFSLFLHKYDEKQIFSPKAR